MTPPVRLTIATNAATNARLEAAPMGDTPTQPERYDRHGDPVFARIPSPGRGASRCEECERTGVAWRWADTTTGETIDERDDNARLVVTACGACAGAGWYPPRPALPPRKARPGSDWDRCESCEGRGGYYYENEDDTVRAHWLWTACDDCSAHVQGEDGIWRNWALFADGSCPDGLGWHPPEIGDVHDQAEQRRLVEVRMYGERLIPQ